MTDILEFSEYTSSTLIITYDNSNWYYNKFMSNEYAKSIFNKLSKELE